MSRFARVKGMSWLLVVWGFFNMVFPLWRGIRHPFVPVPGSSALFSVGLTAVIAGMIFLQVGAWLEDLEGKVEQE